MSNINTGWYVTFLLLVAFIGMALAWDSEKDKRIELEQKLSDCEDIGKMSPMSKTTVVIENMAGDSIGYIPVYYRSDDD